VFASSHYFVKEVKTACSHVCGFLFVVVFSGCSTTLEIDHIRRSSQVESFKPVQLSVPFHAQEEYQCGPAALAMILNWAAVDVTPEELQPLVYVPEKQGSFTVEIKAATRQFGRLPYVIQPSLSTLIKELNAGNPVLVFQNLGLDWFPKWHFAVVTGIDVPANQITLNSGTIKDHKMNLETFERTWQRADKWAMVAMQAGRLPVSADPLSLIKATAYFEHHKKLDLAKSFYQAAVERWPKELMVLMANANLSYQMGMLDDAHDFYQKTLQVSAQYAPAHNNLAMVLMAQDRLPEARRHAQLAIDFGGKHVENYRQTLLEVEQKLRQKP
jgi:tetratricopeptide (TPR) repeat protein